MYTYSYHEHTADIRLQVQADSLQELFAGALEGMNNLLQPDFCSKKNAQDVSGAIDEGVALEAPDSALLIIDFLADVLTLSHMHKAIFCSVRFDQISSEKVNATVFGYSVDFFEEDIKAVTYHEAKVYKNDAGKLEAHIVFDI